MSEFINRIELQREVIKIVNNSKLEYSIAGLSKKSIERWCSDNKIDSESKLTGLLFVISDKLFFLANKSQEQITDNYIKISDEVSGLVKSLDDLISSNYK